MADPVQAARTAFNSMRESLVARGLLDCEYRLTAAGNAYADKLIAERKVETARLSMGQSATKHREKRRARA
jgi:hypothetical protein